MNILDVFDRMNRMQDSFDIMFTIVSILVGCVFVFVIAMLISPKLRGKMLSRQVKSLKHMTDYAKDDLSDIQYNVTDASIKAKKRVLDDNYENLEDAATKEANINKEAIRIKTKAIRDGIVGSDTMYCKHCGEKIDSDSSFCKICGKKLK